jgi:NADH:ubiquinone reductase (H+-translocating)
MASRRIVILGGGFGGAYCAKALEKEVRAVDCEIYLIDKRNYFVFYPLLIEAGAGNIEPRHAVVPIRPFLRKTHFHTGQLRNLDTAARKVFYDVPEIHHSREVEYDELVISLGSITRMIDIPGLRDHAFEMKSLTDAVALRDRSIEMLETAESSRDPEQRSALLHFVVVGGNFTGVEVAGEFQHFLREASRFYRHVRPEECRVTLIELAPRILSALDESLSDYAAEHLRKLGVDVRLKSSINQVGPDRVYLTSGEVLSTRTVIWAAGIAPNPLVQSFGFPLDRNGYILCERDFRVRGFENIWAIGDCAVNVDSTGKPYPATAQHAVREARLLARNLTLSLKGLPAELHDIPTRGSLAALGGHRAVAKIGRFRLSGIPAWVVYRTYYLWTMPSWPRKLRIAFDWTLDLLFGRDYVQLGIRR